MSSELEPTNEALRAALERVAAGSSAEAVLEALLAGAVLAAPRVSLYLVRRGRLRGHGASGMSADARQRVAGVDLPIDHGLAAEAVLRPGPWVVSGSDDRWDELEQSQASELVLVWIRLEGGPAALLVGARIPGASPWSPAALAILAAHAQARLEVELARKRAALAAPGPAPPTAAPAPSVAAPAASEPARQPDTLHFTVTVHEPAPPPPPETGLAPYEEPAERSPRSPREEEARRYARLIATDIRLYHEEAVLIGRRNRDLKRRLGDQMERGRESFERRFVDLGTAGVRMLEEAYVEVLAAGDRALIRSDVESAARTD